MAEAKRKKKLEKNGASAVTPPPSSNVYCVRCGMAYSRRKGYFAASHSPMYRGLGYIPICNDCLDKMFEAYCREMGPKEALHRMCLKLDLYWDEEIYDSVERTAGMASRIRSYIGRCNLVKWIDKNYDDTLRKMGIIHAPERISTEMSDESSKVASFDETPVSGEDGEVWVDPEVVEFWGEDFKPEFILKLDRRYKYWTSDIAEGGLDKGAVALYKQICILEETINKDAAEGKAVDKNQSMLNTLLGSVNAKPVQKKTEADAAIDNTPFGVWIDRWENRRPVPEPDPDFQDVDGIIKYITTWFYGHISKTLGIKNVYCKLYEDEIRKMKVERPDLIEDGEGGDDDESFFNLIFGESGA